VKQGQRPIRNVIIDLCVGEVKRKNKKVGDQKWQVCSSVNAKQGWPTVKGAVSGHIKAAIAALVRVWG